MIEFLTTNLLWSEGYHLIIALLALFIGGLICWRPIAYGALIFFIACLFFFRNPIRVSAHSDDDQILLCPADGQIVDITRNHGNTNAAYVQKVAIFLSPLDVHVQWVPMTGTIESIMYRPGTFSLAFLPKSSESNECNEIVITHSEDKRIIVRQIAGTIARKICCWVHQGQKVQLGQKYGMIKFGSRVEIIMPATVDLAVGVGQRVYGGHTILGRWL